MSYKSEVQQKLLLLGDSGVGKSCMLLNYVEDVKGKVQSMPTIGIDFKIKKLAINGIPMKLNIFDTAGQERYRTITAAYYRGSQGVLIVFDIANVQSFNAIRNWIQQLNVHADAGLVRVLVGNKSDLESRRVVRRSEGENLAREYNMPYFETSAINGTNVQQAFESLAWGVHEAVLKKTQEEMERYNESIRNGTASPSSSASVTIDGNGDGSDQGCCY